ncbi:type I methionyl aminopeptidase [Buchnera aphidicola]|uniref:Methionine aminopeptidase n=1 Tax=Buchnera aphidicola str. USDA (Myzus persicae) TaxID=1009856 RepID=W0P057_BUCMP|nr:type I methionyl aminopeptidase [Buchnera aphidicola]AHG60146.1 Map [Buchnera aphidicola str. USDA (Myzus persicae)]AHG60726.1 Map [Buchnera aphidicola str. W106 (Myzus persicae)]AHG61298.1 Map [Buchnera aphidicola str. G002 (Myzus persicae)]AHG61871.1 Map [Buchnera aphidicola str. F009 (Myzus persicae)]WAI03165.1 MAG: type I methionyl aminopeptidase [Buchnera aphidicola (Myzus persicae)]
MSCIIKTESEIKKMRISGKLAAEVLEMVEKHLKPNISTEDINQICHDYIFYEKKALSACLGYHGFPKSICTSINDVVCHGIPSKKQILKEGDIINIDITIIKNNYHGDTSKMFLIGKTSILSKRLCQVAQESLYRSLKIIQPGIPLYKIGEVIQNYVEKNNFSIVKEYCGHGIGRNFHEEPHVLHYKNKENNVILEKGMIFTIEPMINSGHSQVKCMKDGWTVKTKDRSLSAQYEHTILVTEYGCDILTWQKNERISPTLFNKK